MNNFVQKADVVDLVAPYDVSSGDGALVGSLFGVALVDLTSGTAGAFQTTGVINLATDTGAAWTQGEKIYWDNTNKVATATATSNTLIGCAAAAKTSGATTCDVRLNGTVS